MSDNPDECAGFRPEYYSTCRLSSGHTGPHYDLHAGWWDPADGQLGESDGFTRAVLGAQQDVEALAVELAELRRAVLEAAREVEMASIPIDYGADTVRALAYKLADLADPVSGKYAVVIEEGEDSFSAYSPDLPGVIAAAEDRDELKALMREAIAFHLGES